MAASFQSDGGTVFAAAASNAAITVTLPATRPVGSVLLLVAFCRQITASVTTAPSGYTLLTSFPATSGTAAGGRVWVYARVVDGTESAPTIAMDGTTGTTGDEWGAYLCCYDDVDTTGGLAGILDGTPTVTDASGTTTCTYPALTIAQTDSMIVRALARWRDAVDTFTFTATWAEREDAGTTNRTGANFHLQDKAATASGSQASVTVAPSNTTATRYLAVTLALKSAPVGFPTTSLLDDFNRANGALGSNWPLTWVPGVPKLVVSSNTAVWGASNSTSIWTATYGPDCEVWAKVAARGSGDMILMARVHNADTASYNGYELVIIGSTWQFYWIDSGGGAAIGGTATQAVASGDSVGASFVGSSLKAFYKPAAGSWTKLITATDTTFTTAGQIGMEVDGATCAWDDFAGGTIGATAARKPRQRVTPTVAVVRAGVR